MTHSRSAPLVPSSYGDPSLLLLYKTPCEWMLAGKRMRLLKTMWISSPTSARMVGPSNPRCSSAAVRFCEYQQNDSDDKGTGTTTSRYTSGEHVQTCEDNT